MHCRLWFSFVALAFFVITSKGCQCEDPVEQPTPNADMTQADMTPDLEVDLSDMRVCPTGQHSDGLGGCTTDPCLPSNNCDANKGLRCVNDQGEARCECEPGKSPDGDGVCVADEQCTETTCNGHGLCSKGDQGLQCACETGYTGPFCGQCQTGYVDDGQGGCTNDLCAVKSCQDPFVCKVEGNAAACVCPAGTHEEAGDCVQDRTCQPTTCNGHGQCSEANGQVSCVCMAGWDGAFCDTCDAANGYHPDGNGGCTTDPCLPNPCTMPNKTVCADDNGQASCSCDVGYHLEGANCVVDEVCQPDSCSGRGQCTVVDGLIVCTCDMGAMGNRCQMCDMANGYHPDGQGGCTTDPCLPNPCTMPNKTVCMANGPVNTTCSCDPGYHPDGQGGCTSDPCLPDPCVMNNQACRDNNGQAECYTPMCNDNNPCTEDRLVNGQCTYTDLPNDTSCSTDVCTVGQTCQQGQCSTGMPRDCEDGNPCTLDVCDPAQNGCVSTVDDTIVPDDGVDCTVGVCQNGVASYTNDDALCDDGLYCNGEERCLPNAQDADAQGCVIRDVPQPPANPSPCQTHGACDEASQSFPLVTLGAGTVCDDGIYCTANDVCDTQGACLGTYDPNCSQGSCTTTHPYTPIHNIPIAQMQYTITLGGQPLPASNRTASGNTFSPRNFILYAVSKDTGAWHNIYRQEWGSNGQLYTPRTLERLVPGVYDIMYRRDYSTTDNIADYTYYTGDLYPNGLRYLQRDVVLGSGSHVLDIDIPVAEVQYNITLGGQPLPTSNQTPNGNTYSPRNFILYAVSKDTGAWHTIYRQEWGSNGQLYTPRVLERLVPGTYDILYRRDYSTTDNIADYTYYTDDAYPNGLRYLQRDVVLNPGANTLNIDIPTTRVQYNITLGGQPLPASNQTASGNTFSPRNFILYAVSKDTGAWHNIYRQEWGSNGQLYTPRTLEQLVPGTYDILYRRDYSTTDNIADYTYYTGDLYPNGLRYLQRDVVIGSTPMTLDIDIPAGDMQYNITLGGQPLPASNQTASGNTFSPRNFILYAVSKDTGAWHNIYRQEWGSNGQLYTPRVLERLVPGTYDILYRRDYSTTDNIADYTYYTGDLYPNGLRYLQRDVVVSAGSNTLNVDIPVAEVQYNISLNGQPLPTSNQTASGNTFSPRNFILYAVSKDTGAWHNIYRQEWGSNGQLYTPRTLERLVPGTYDIMYRRDYSTTDNIADYTYYTGDVYPNGLRYLQRDVVLSPGANTLNIDIATVAMQYDILLDGQPLPTSNQTPSGNTFSPRNFILYAVARDTGAWHNIYRQEWGSGGQLYTPRVLEQLVPGVYDILYRRDYSTTDNIADYTYYTDDLYPNGLRYLDRCVEVR